jgi:hypothetical protein
MIFPTSGTLEEGTYHDYNRTGMPPHGDYAKLSKFAWARDKHDPEVFQLSKFVDNHANPMESEEVSKINFLITVCYLSPKPKTTMPVL